MSRPVRRLGNLPAESTSLIGRRRELAEVRGKLSAGRLVCLVGPGGVGKTRLATRIAADLGRGFRAGTWLVELAEVRDPRLIPNAVMSALDLRDQSAAEPLSMLQAHLRDRELLLVLDSCEHILGGAARLTAEILKAAPLVRMIATSREPLSVAGEHVIPVPPLELPPTPVDIALDRVLRSEAVMLFVDRADAATGDFELTAVNRAAVVEVCRRLDGMPLAIELAAVRTRALAPQQIVDRLSDRFSLLTGGSNTALARHQTLHATIDWSYDLLTTPERNLLRRLSVFTGRFTLEDVESICTFGGVGAGQTLSLLASLIDKSLVTKEEARGAACYRLHETMREYASRKLKESGEDEEVEERCRDHYSAACGRAASVARRGLVEWLGWVDLEIDNVRSVLQRCLAHGDVVRGLDLARSLVPYWTTRATSEGARWLDDLIACGPDDSTTLARACFLRGWLGVLQADGTSAGPPLERAVTAARRSGHVRLLSQSLALAAVVADIFDNRAEAGRLLAEAAVVLRGTQDSAARLMLMQARALDGLFRRDLDSVIAAASEGARISREAGDLHGLEHMLLNLGLASLIAGDIDQSARLCAEGLRIAHEIDDRVAQFYLLGVFACHAARRGRARFAAQLLGASEAMRLSAGATVNGIFAPLRAQAETSAVAALGTARFQAELATGHRMSRAAALRLAVGGPVGPATPRLAGGATGPLGRREAEIAALVAEGLSNKEIGVRLFISDRTVASHVRSILNKLGFNSRAQIAAWVVSRH